MSSIAERPVLGLLTVAQVIIAGLLNLKPNRLLLDFVVNIFMSSCKDFRIMKGSLKCNRSLTITERLRLRFAAKTPRKVLLFYKIHLEWFFVVNHSILGLVLSRNEMLDGVFRDRGGTKIPCSRSASENVLICTK